MQSRRSSFLYRLAAIYATSILVYLAYTYRNILFAAPLVPLILCIKLGRFYVAATLAIAVFINMVVGEPYLAIPLSIVLPLIVGEAPVDEMRPSFLGATSTKVARYLLILAPLVLVNPRISIVITATLLTTFIFSLTTFRRLSKISAKLVYRPDEITLGEKASIAINIRTPIRSYITVEYGGNRRRSLVNGEETLYIDFQPLHIGRHALDISVAAFDVQGFSGRRIARFSVEFNVVPLTSRVIEVVGRSLAAYGALEKPLADVEISVFDIDLGSVVVSGKGVAILRAAGGYIHRATLYPYAEEVAERLLSVLEELSYTVSEYTEGGSRGRYGEYIGIRHYTPGDPLKLIHWKKSVSRGELVTKEFSIEVPEGVYSSESRGLEPIVVVDLYASNTVELDRIVFTAIRLCLKIFEKDPLLHYAIILVLGNTLLILKGRAVELLHSLYKTFRDTPIHTIYSYTPIKIDEKRLYKILRLERRPRLISTFIASGNIYAKRFLELFIREKLLPPKSLTIIHSDSLSFRYTIVKYTLSRYGYVSHTSGKHSMVSTKST